MLNWDDVAWAKYNELRDRRDRKLEKALEDALELIEDDPDSSDARQSRFESVEDGPTVWIADAPSPAAAYLLATRR
ncbi:hypothetical protein [Mycobacterium malmoense]|uniref:hypothetical protein n=1 Tax=Mycobacterium malmoense TaxID=1780 RepID=UPI001C4329C1|nr:hypothetical protein [Mycobacterium malmoense]